MANYTQITEYNESRMGLIIVNPGPDDLTISTNFSDLLLTPSLGKVLCVNEDWKVSWIEMGELCWQNWYANCTRCTPLVWEWFSTPILGDPYYAPNRSPSFVMERKMEGNKCRSGKRIVRASAYERIRIRGFVERIRQNGCS